MKTLQLLCWVVFMINGLFLNAQTPLAAGDIAIVGVYGFNDATYDDSFAFVALRNFTAGTTIYFTDKGWTESNAFYQLSPLGETTVTYVAQTAVNAGTVIYFYGSKSGSTPGFTYTNNNTFSTISDQWFAYQGTESTPTFLYGLQLGNIGWVTTPGTSQSTNNSWLPSGLTVGSSAITFSAGQDNAVYTGGGNTNMATLRTMIGNSSNWTTGTTTTRPAFPSGPLPVELKGFSASIKNGIVQLQWSTATEVNNSGFAIERKQVDQERSKQSAWAEIGFVKGAGNANTQSDYGFTDTKPLYGKLQYRLRQIDNDGSIRYFYSAEIDLQPIGTKLMQNYPNPFNPETKIRYRIATDAVVTLRLYDVLGRELYVMQNKQMPAGEHEVVFNADKHGLSTGLYYYQLQAGDYNEIRKMLLVK